MNEKERRIYNIYLCPTCKFFEWDTSGAAKNIGNCKASKTKVRTYKKYSITNPPPDCKDYIHGGKRARSYREVKPGIKKAPKKAPPKNEPRKGLLFQGRFSNLQEKADIIKKEKT